MKNQIEIANLGLLHVVTDGLVVNLDRITPPDVRVSKLSAGNVVVRTEKGDVGGQLTIRSLNPLRVEVREAKTELHELWLLDALQALVI